MACATGAIETTTNQVPNQQIGTVTNRSIQQKQLEGVGLRVIRGVAWKWGKQVIKNHFFNNKKK